jgi:hypothetical protein
VLDDPQPGVVLGEEVIQRVARAVGTAVVDHDDLKVVDKSRERLEDVLDQRADVGLLVVSGKHH